MVDNSDLPLLDEGGAGDGDSQAATNGGNQTKDKPSGDSDAGAAGSADKTVPLERFRAVEDQVRYYKDLGLDGIAEELRRDPSKIHDIRAALAGTAVRPQPKGPSKEDTDNARKAWSQLNESDPMAAQLMTAQAAAKAVLDEAIAPIRKIALRQSIEAFKSKGRGSVPYFNNIEPIFDQLVGKMNLSGLDDTQLDAALGQALFTAMGISYARSLDKAQQSGKLRVNNNPPQLGSGGSPGGTGPVSRKPEMDAETTKAIKDVAKWGQLTEEELSKLLEA